MPGTELCADLLTKSITQSQSWEAFRRSVGLRAAETSLPDGVGTSRAKKVACAAMASLGLLAAVPGLGGAVKLASLLGLAAAATVACPRAQEEPGEGISPIASRHPLSDLENVNYQSDSDVSSKQQSRALAAKGGDG